MNGSSTLQYALICGNIGYIYYTIGYAYLSEDFFMKSYNILNGIKMKNKNFS